MALAADIHPQPSTVLLTGFGPFPGIPENVSARLVADVGARARIAFAPHRFHVSILPTEWDAAPQRLIALIARLRPAIALHFGVAKDADGFRIETRGLNQCRMAIDAAGRMPSGAELISGAPVAYEAGLPLEKIVSRLQDMQLPVSKSYDAGGYLCNSVLYHSLHAAPNAGTPLRAGFIHIPSSFADPGFSFEDAAAGSLEIIRVALEAAQTNR